jgi:hypothetical protein
LRLASTTGEKQGDEPECETMKRFELFHAASVSNGHATSFAQLQVKRNTGCRFENETDRFRFREKHKVANAATMLGFLEGASDRHTSLKSQVASPDHRGTESSCRPSNGRRATDLPMVRFSYWVGSSGHRPHRQDYLQREGQPIGWPHIHLHQQWFAQQRSRPKRAPRPLVCRERELFSFEVGSLSNSGPDARFSTYQLSVNLSKSKM